MHVRVRASAVNMFQKKCRRVAYWFLSFRLTKSVSHPPSRGGVPPSAAGLRWILKRFRASAVMIIVAVSGRSSPLTVRTHVSHTVQRPYRLERTIVSNHLVASCDNEHFRKGSLTSEQGDLENLQQPLDCIVHRAGEKTIQQLQFNTSLETNNNT